MSGSGAVPNAGRWTSPPDSQADFAGWVEPHLVAMYRIAARLAPGCDPDDIVQDSLHRAWRRRSTFVPDRGTPRTWLLAIVRDQSSKSRVRTWRYRRTTSAAVDRVEAAEPNVDLERAIAQLAPRQREVVMLHYFVDLSVRETAAVLGLAEGTVKSTLSDARSRLRDLMSKESSHD